MAVAGRRARREVIPAGVGRDPWRAAAETLLAETGCTVRRWRPKLSGTAWTESDDWGIEVPPPSTPVRFGILAHEVGHQLLHRHGSKQRWLEEFEAWEYALAQFDRFDLPGRAEVASRAHQSGRYAMGKALRRAKRDDTRNLIVDRWQSFHAAVSEAAS